MNNYQILENIYESQSCKIVRALRKEDQKSVIIKSSSNLLEDFSEKLKNEYQLLSEIDSPYIIKAIDFHTEADECYLILEDINGISLHQYLEVKKLKTQTFLDFSLMIIEGVKAIHSLGIIHKDINPYNIIINEDENLLQIIDFGFSDKANNSITNKYNYIQGNCEYIAPEQTGHFNVNQDFRTDIYSLGITFYEMLTGTLPFIHTDISELIHSHIAIQAIPPHEKNLKIPVMLSTIIMKMIAKAPTDRYQTIIGLKKDFEKCRFVLTDENEIPQFQIALEDYSYSNSDDFSNFLSDSNAKGLDHFFFKINNGAHLCIVYSHFGKIINQKCDELFKYYINEHNCLFLQADFLAYNNKGSQSILSDILSQIVNYILFSSGSIDKWKKTISEKLGENTSVLNDIFVGFKDITEQTESLRPVSVKESRQRYLQSLKDLFSLLPKREKPLVIFLKNAQLAGTDTLEFLNYCILSNDLNYFCLFYEYQTDSPLDNPPLFDGSLNSCEVKAEVIQFKPADLSLEEISIILSEKFLWSYEEANEIALLMYQKTLGNPYFLDLILKNCFLENIIHLDYDIELYVCDTDRLHSLELSTNVVNLIFNKLDNLDQEVKNTLFLCSCIGHVFDIECLTAVSNNEQDYLRKHLKILIINEFIRYYIIAENENQFEFTHPQFAEACYLELDPKAKDLNHLALYRYYSQPYQDNLYSTDYVLSDMQIFKSAWHINQIKDISLIPNYDSLHYHFNKQAAEICKSNADFNQAFEYYKTAVSPYLSDLVKASDVQQNIIQTLIDTADLAILFNEENLLELIIEKGLLHANQAIDQVRFLELKIRTLLAANELDLSIKTGLKALKLLGLNLPDKPGKAQVIYEFLKCKHFLSGFSDDSWQDIIINNTSIHKPIINIMLLMSVSTYISKPYLLAIIIFRALRLIREESPVEGIHFITGYAMILCGQMNAIEKGFHIGNQALKLIEKNNLVKHSAKTVFTLAAFILPWKLPLSKSLPLLLNAQKNAQEMSDLEYSANSAVTYTYMAFLNGENLDHLMLKVNEFSTMLHTHKQKQIFLRNALWLQAILNFYHSNNDPFSLNGHFFEEKDILDDFIKQQNKTAVFDFCLIKMILGVFFGEYDKAYQYCHLAQENIEARTGSVVTLYFHFYHSLILINMNKNDMKIPLQQIVRTIQKNQKILYNRALLNPDNFMNKYYLIEAEKHRLLKHYEKAESFYAKSIELSARSGFIYEEALVKEYFAQLYFEKGLNQFSSVLLTSCMELYDRWHGFNKKRQLTEKYPDEIKEVNLNKKGYSENVLSYKDKAYFETDSILKTYKVISGEVNIENLLKKLTSLIMQNAGAGKAILCLKEKEQFVLKAITTPDSSDFFIHNSPDIDNVQDIPHIVIKKTINEEKSIICDVVQTSEYSLSEVYYNKYKIKSFLCMPILWKNQIQGVLYLENQYIEKAFSQNKLSLLELIAVQFASSLETAKLYSNIEQSEEKFRTLVDNLHDGVFIIQNDVIQYVNKSFMSIFGMQADDIINHHLSKIISEKDTLRINQMIQMIFDGKQVKTEYELQAKHHDGKEIPVLLSAGLFTLNNNEALVGTVKDITERKTAEQLQKQYNESLKRKINEKTKSIKNLLDYAGQGFLTFNQNLLINNEFSKECLHIFKSDISQRDFVELVFSHLTEEEKEDNRIVINAIFNTDLYDRKTTFLDLLPQECHFDDKYIKLDYKMIPDIENEKIMVVITDISDKIALEKEMEKEKNILKMVVKAISDSSLLKKAVKEYQDFFTEGLKETLFNDLNLQERVHQVFRQVHTFKGDFSQWSMMSLAEHLMGIEDILTTLLNHQGQRSAEEIYQSLVSFPYHDWIDDEIKTICDRTGQNLLDEKETVLVDKKKILEIENDIIRIFSEKDSELLLAKIRKLRYSNIKDIIYSYSDYIDQLADKLDKLINPLVVTGDDVFLDYDIYASFIKTLTHIFRNMIDHGIEYPDVRLENGFKSEAGNICCHVKTEANCFTIELNDDGAGIDLEKIRNLLKKINQEDLEFYEILQSVICKNQSKNPDLLSDEEILPLIFYPGFSTKNQITDISGRGIGLSAVKQEIEKLGGSLTVNTIQNTGTCFVIKLPYIYTPSSLQQDTIFEQTIEQILIQFYLEQTGIQLHKMDSDHQNDLLDYASCIKLEGNKSRIIILTTGSSIMDISFEKMLKDASLNEENESMKQQCLSEILNIICGNALTELEVHDSDLKLHTPYSVKAQAFHFIQNSWPLKRLSYEYQGDKLHIYYA